jgi:SAM-dependent methyltransferase
MTRHGLSDRVVATVKSAIPCGPRRRLAACRDAIRQHGDRVECPCCGATFGQFADVILPRRMCWKCRSLERHRSLALYLRDHPEITATGTRILHVAPEKSLRSHFDRPGVIYLAGDLNPTPPDVKFDITDLPFDDGSFDGVVCNHVLEHVPDDRRALREIHRVLTAAGWAILLVPDVSFGARRDVTDEEPDINDPVEQLRRFGQADHVRRYGWDYLDRLRASGLEVEVIDMRTTLEPADVERYGLQKMGEIEPLFLARKPAVA